MEDEQIREFHEKLSERIALLEEKNDKLSEASRRIEGEKRYVESELLRLQKDKQAVLYPIDNPQSLKPEDRDAAIDVLGFKRHIVLMKGEAA